MIFPPSTCFLLNNLRDPDVPLQYELISSKCGLSAMPVLCAQIVAMDADTNRCLLVRLAFTFRVTVSDVLTNWSEANKYYFNTAKTESNRPLGEAQGSFGFRNSVT